jgi:hypothetical protein
VQFGRIGLWGQHAFGLHRRAGLLGLLGIEGTVVRSAREAALAFDAAIATRTGA